jgi:hypothetical protein
VGAALFPAVQDRLMPVVKVVGAHHEHVLDPDQLLADGHTAFRKCGIEGRQDIAARR